MPVALEASNAHAGMQPTVTVADDTGGLSDKGGAGTNLGLCEGDCGDDSDCKGPLRCFQRSGSSDVPGCAPGGTGDVSGHDYCIEPRASTRSRFPSLPTSRSLFCPPHTHAYMHIVYTNPAASMGHLWTRPNPQMLASSEWG